MFTRPIKAQQHTSISKASIVRYKPSTSTSRSTSRTSGPRPPPGLPKSPSSQSTNHTPGTQGEQGQKKKFKIPDPPFQNDGNPTWEDWHVDMNVKLKSEATWDEEEKM